MFKMIKGFLRSIIFIHKVIYNNVLYNTIGRISRIIYV